MKKYAFLWISLVIFVLDQVTKFIIKSTMALHESFSVIGDFLRITYIENPGMAFGLSFGDNVFFTVFAVIASLAILVYMFKMKGEHILARIAMAFIFGGALGNLLDRLLRGSVVDFIDTEFFNVHIPAFDFMFINFPGFSMHRWPVFNVADMGVTIGMILLFIFIIFEDDHPKEEDKDDSEMIH
jgi:signal peptidase II